ncbi:exopolysaccharide biosynthesis protein : Capsular exopolysaccharide biosynthesis protein OS=Singulisphaera acidiphila (strain ATCC BAA-1392 / DSM 18658 / VKM B-2454 / MOB10) GN=Sinac_5456 PE=4 SV=1: AAA_31 [Gemmata massiliana]|uniref:AAA domain-containing protein n=1 Tax=Gemmata massiliana TaxID=1210884 RepID=A0A6P2DEK1_9BACT|nr:polysaccharide biosynthesis tyrosine autokinase [Gemmata massiliana]VTS00032.1 exopolysaccharide biosynthesis protein : Capsular exopolysaccharide biosynthesis protein OS=Singulisphaera acidiphila (strain ATCC BAA-1392 / DSM 18658 / VKM B-2454 / MOB10) GN=Sinac_5456 PE=4 SV=1: AAA_31 [Gemmata massiliana]
MARPIAGDSPMIQPPYQAPQSGVPVPVVTSPFNYTNQPNIPGPVVVGTPTPLGLLNAFRRRWVLSTFIGGLVAVAVAVGIWLALPAGKHQARALVQLQPKQVEFVNKTQEDFEAYRRHQMFLLKTRDVLTRVLADPAVSSLDTIKQSEDPVSMLEDTIRVTVAAPEILEVTLTGNNIEDMKVILDHVVRRYVDDATAIDRKQRDDQIAALETTLTSIERELKEQKSKLELAGRTNGTTGAEATSNALALLQKRHIEADALFVAAGREIEKAEAELKVLQKQLEDKDPKTPPDQAIVAQLVAADVRVKTAKSAYTARKEYADKEAAKATNPDIDDGITKLRAEVKKLETEVKEAEKLAATEAIEVARAIDTAKKKKRVEELAYSIEVKKGEREGHRLEREGLQRVIATTAAGGLSIEEERKNLQPQREMHDKIQTQLIQLRIAAQQSGRVSARGGAEKIPNNNQNKKIVMSSAGGFVSFFGVILLVSFLEWRSRRVDGVDQVVNELGMRVIGTVPAFPNRASLQAATEAGGANWRFVLNESINSTRTMLLHTAKAQAMQVVMVTSATQGEGKTSLASQLATSMATAGMRTLIVDCDLRNPSIMKLFELPLAPGVSEVLRQEVDVSDAVQATAVPNLWVIPAGHCSNATIAALAQGNPLKTLFNRLRGQFDFVIVDSCPVLPVADALLIAQHVDGVVFSIMQDVSQLPKVVTASEKLTQLNIQMVGAVVNGIKQDVYSYGYNYVKQLPA